MLTCAPSFLASRPARLIDDRSARQMMSVIRYPASAKELASAVPRFPGPTIATLGLRLMPGSIAEQAPGVRLQALGFGHIAAVYIVSMPKAKPARVISSRVVFRGPVFSVSTDKVIEPTGITARRDIIHHPGSVVILAVDESRCEPRVLLEWQYRHAAQAFLWELPAGRVDEGEQELAAAKRELIEETGYTAERWERAFKYFASPGFMNETMAVYLAQGLRRGKAQPEADESIRVRLLPVSDAVQRIVKGTIRDGKTIAGVLWLERRLRGA